MNKLSPVYIHGYVAAWHVYIAEYFSIGETPWIVQTQSFQMLHDMTNTISNAPPQNQPYS